ncbi:MAG: PIN domain-containing protein [Oscillospiraceae bacterium]|nr:PIN domain-containing protein [Oscillospiraceae bacterium]
MNKTRLFIDTSVISHLDAPDTPDKMQDTHKLWDEIKTGVYDILISDIVIEEIARCSQPKLDKLLGYLAEIEYQRIDSNDEIEEIAAQIIELKILKEKSRDDCMHIGAAIAGKCDYLVSWNFKHMVNVKTIKGVRAVTNLLGYNNIDIIQPTMLVEKGE